MSHTVSVKLWVILCESEILSCTLCRLLWWVGSIIINMKSTRCSIFFIFGTFGEFYLDLRPHGGIGSSIHPVLSRLLVFIPLTVIVKQTRPPNWRNYDLIIILNHSTKSLKPGLSILCNTVFIVSFKSKFGHVPWRYLWQLWNQSDHVICSIWTWLLLCYIILPWGQFNTISPLFRFTQW